jgi:hypothetical protein
MSATPVANNMVASDTALNISMNSKLALGRISGDAATVISVAATAALGISVEGLGAGICAKLYEAALINNATAPNATCLFCITPRSRSKACAAGPSRALSREAAQRSLQRDRDDDSRRVFDGSALLIHSDAAIVCRP